MTNEEHQQLMGWAIVGALAIFGVGLGVWRFYPPKEEALQRELRQLRLQNEIDILKAKTVTE